MPIQRGWDEICATVESTVAAGKTVQDYYLCYYGFNRPAFREFYFDDESRFEVEVIDTWEMTIENRGVASGKFKVELPGKEYMAVRLRRI